MSQENEIDDAQVIHRLYEAVAAGDTETFAGELHPDVVWEHNLGAGSPEEGTYRGREDVAALIGRILDAWQQMRLEPKHTSSPKRGSYVVRGDLYARHMSSPAEVVTPFEHRLEIQNGLLIKGSRAIGSQVE